jgi:PAS domain-containing protein
MTTRIGSFLLKESSDAMVTTTPEGKMTYWTKGVETMFGYTRADAVGRFVEGIIVPQDRRAEQPGAGSAACRCKFFSEMACVSPLWLSATDSERPPTGSRSSLRDSRILRDALTDVSVAGEPPSRFFFRFAMCRLGRGYPPHLRTGIRNSPVQKPSC